MTKVTIVSGFLGAGKTTFIKELISKVYKDQSIVLIENEFGEIGVDSHFMQNTGIQVTEMNAGCICCTLVGDFARALEEVVHTYRPDRIIIEPSGVGKLSDVAQAIESLPPALSVHIDNKITVVDGKKARLFIKNFGEFFNNQIESATTLVISRSQDMDERRLQECFELLREHNAAAPIITTPWEQLSGQGLRDALAEGESLEKQLLRQVMNSHHEHHKHHENEHHEQEHEHHEHGHEHEHEHEHHHHHGHTHEQAHESHPDGCTCGCGHDHHHSHHHADEVFESWGEETIHAFDPLALAALLEKLDDQDRFGMVLRAKGILADRQGGWLEFDMVPGEVQIRKGHPDYTGRLCVIGSGLHRDELRQAFYSC